MKSIVYDFIKSCNQDDLELLYKIYLMRCLTGEQAYQLFGKEKTFSEFINQNIKNLVLKNVIELSKYGKDSENKFAIFLTSTGVDVVRNEFDLPIEVFSNDSIKKGYYRAHELKMQPRLINHQAHLNQFVIDFENTLKIHNKDNIHWDYYDEKYVSQYRSIRPDGLIRIAGVDLFLEMDMSTESSKQLLEKWSNYLAFLISNEFAYSSYKIIVLFIIEGTANIEKRKELVRKLALDTIMDNFKNNFEIIVGSTKEIVSILGEELLPALKGENDDINNIKSLFENTLQFKVSSGEPLIECLNNFEYLYYVRKTNKENTIIIENGKVQEYLIDYYSYNTLSILSKMSYSKKNSHLFSLKYKRSIDYIIIAKDLKLIYKELKLFNISTDNIFFTTIERLSSMEFHKALCRFDAMGRIYTFENNGFNKISYE